MNFCLKHWIVWFVLLTSGVAEAAALNKYAVPGMSAQPAVTPRATAAPANGLDLRQREALTTLQRLPPATRKKWLDAFARQEREAVARRDYVAARYYQGILREANRNR